MNLPELVLLGVVGAIALVLVYFVVRLYLLTKHINNAFNKLGFVLRQDTKQYFDDAASKIVETNDQFQSIYQKAIADATQKVLVDSGVVMERALSDAHVKAGKVILQAQSDAQNIIAAAKEQANQEYDAALKRSVDTLGWALQQYLKEQVDLKHHEQIIQKMINAYLNENRK